MCEPRWREMGLLWGSGERRRSLGQRAVASLVWVPMAALGPLCFVVGAPFPITERAGLQQPLPVLTACDPSLTGLTETNGKAFVTRPEKRDGRTYHLCPPPAGL